MLRRFGVGFALSVTLAFAQDAKEALGAVEKKGVTTPHPLLAIEARHPAALKKELAGVHPRVFVTQSEIDGLKRRARTSHKALWQHSLAAGLALRTEPEAPPAQTRRAQNNVGLAIAEAAFAYKIEGDPKYLAAAKKFMDAAVSYEVWGYANSKPNVDLAAGHLLYGLGWGYDLLYNDLSEAEREKYRAKLVKQARLLFDYYALKPGKSFSYSQNHLYIPAAGLAVAAYALYDEVPEAANWARRVRALYDRVLATYSMDGYYYEGFEYWVFSTPWIIHYLDALAHSTGQDLFDSLGLRNAHTYVAHSMLPGGKNVFDFGDAFEGPKTRAALMDGKDAGGDVRRTHPGGNLHSNYHLLYRLAGRFKNGEAQGVADWLRSLGQVTFEDYWSLIWYDPAIQPVPIGKQPTMHYFPDHQVVYWRSSWDAAATAIAIKCGPPEGHKAATLETQFRDWHTEAGHAHPDAASFILFANGRYLTGDSGYAGIPLTAHHNTLLVDGRGQVKEGSGHNAFGGVPYARLNKLRLTKVEPQTSGLLVEADATAAYEPGLGIERFVRRFHLTASSLSIEDDIAASSPRMFSTLIHFDGLDKPAGLTIDIREPKDAAVRVEPNVLTAPGPPGSVDKGPQEIRGSRYVIATPVPQNKNSLSCGLVVLGAGGVENS